MTARPHKGDRGCKGGLQVSLTYVGKPIPRLDGREKVTGQAVYTATMEVAGALVGRALRSPLPHAMITRLDASAAEKVPGVVAVLTRDDIKHWGITPLFGSLVKDQPVVALDRVRFVGDIVAAVAAETEEAAQEALDLIEVEYEELPAIYDVYEAVAPGADLLHPSQSGSVLGTGDTQGVTSKQGTNVVGYFRIRKGDVEAGMREADHVFTHEFSLPAVSHAALEPFAAIAEVHPDGSIDCWSATQTPSAVRQQLSDTFKVPFSKVRVRVPLLGGGFGAKCYGKIEPLAVALAKKARRPVRLVLNREESFLTVTRHGARMKIQTGVKADGTITARKSEIYYDAGAYADVSPRVCKNGAYPGSGPYRIPNVWVDSHAVYTNKAPAGAYRGYGVTQICWGVESHTDEVARALGMDPLAFRLKNALHDGDRTHTNQVAEGMPVTEVLEAAAKAVEWEKERLRLAPGAPLRGKFRGRGIAGSIKGSSPSISNATMKMNEDGSIDAMVSTVEIGQGSETALSQIAAEALCIPIENVHIVRPDTAVTPYDRSTSSSRSVYMMGNALIQAAGEIKEQLLRFASDLLEVSPADLDLDAGTVVVRGQPDRKISYSDIIRKHYGSRVGNLMGRGICETKGGLSEVDGQGIATEFWETSASSCEVEVDVETGQVKLLNYAVTADVGKMINPVLCTGQVEGAAMQALSATFHEEIVYSDGQPVNPNFLDYGLATAAETPPRFSSILLEHPAPKGPYGAHGVGETGLMAAAPAVANAIYDAVGVRIYDLPITPEKVLKALKERRS